MGLTLPFRDSSVASIQRNTFSRIKTLVREPEEHSNSILHTIDPMDDPSDIEEDQILSTNPDSRNELIAEGTSYDPSRGYNRASPIGADDSDITPPVSELEQDSNEDPIISDIPERPDLVLPDKQEQEVPSDVVQYNESVVDDVKQAVGLEPPKGEPKSKKNCHVHYNTQFYNNIFYNRDYAASITAMNQFEFLMMFYPNMITHDFVDRISTSIGGMALDPGLYREIGLRYPLDDNIKNMEIGSFNINPEDIELQISIYYEPHQNWFKVNLASDVDHICYCLKIYSLVSYMIMNSNFSYDELSSECHDVIAEWASRVITHYHRMNEEEEYSTKWFMELQYMHDLMWNFIDNPMDSDTIARHIGSFAAYLSGNSAKLTSEIFSKAEYKKYMEHELQCDVKYLIPELYEFPIIDQASVRMAMDIIRTIEKEYENYLKSYTTNLNKMYRLLGCTFAISDDHPYAKYADDSIRIYTVKMLAESDTAVNDTDGASDISGPNNKTDQPWYKRLDYTGTLYRDGSENKEMGPNTKPMQRPDYTQYDSFL